MESFGNFLKEETEVLAEAKFSVEKINKAIDLMASVGSKFAKAKFHRVKWKEWGEQDFVKSDGTKGTGILFMNKAGEKLRIGYAQTKSMKKDRMEVNCMDFWDSSNTNLDSPTRSVVCFPHYNISVIAKEVMEYVITGQEKTPLKEAYQINEAGGRTTTKFVLYCQSLGIKTDGLDDKDLKGILRNMGIKFPNDEYRGFKKVSTEETNTAVSSVKQVTKQLAGRKFSDPEYVFDDIIDLTKIIASGHQNSLIIAGQAGVGKTYGVEKTLESELGPEGKKWKHYKGGKVSTFGLYSALFQHRENKVIVFDDSDSVWKNEDSVNILKSALDTYDVRKLSWNSPNTAKVGSWDQDMKNEYNKGLDYLLSGKKDPDKEQEGVKHEFGRGDSKLPDEFLFTSQVIFISNLEPNKIDSAIRSRSLFMDINLKREDILNRIKNILDLNPKYADISKDERHSIVDSLAEGSGEITMRAVEAAIACRSCEGIKGDWKRLASQYASGS